MPSVPRFVLNLVFSLAHSMTVVMPPGPVLCIGGGALNTLIVIVITPLPVGTGSGVLFSLDFFLSFFLSFFVCMFLCFFVSKITRKRLDRFA